MLTPNISMDMPNSVWILSKKNLDEYENRRLLESFSENNIETRLVHPDKFDLIINKKDLTDIWLDEVKIELPSAVLVRTGSGSTYFSLAVMRQLESLGIPVINCSTSIDMVKDKLQTSQLLAKHGIPIPKTMLVRWPINADLVASEIGFPCVVKVITGSYGKGVHLCQTISAFNSLMEFIESLNAKKTMIIQEFIDAKIGSDLRVWVVGGKVIGAMQRTSANNDFRANISGGGTGEQYDINEEIDFLARETAKIMGLDIAGIDLLFDKDGFKVCEANSAPGFEGMEQYCNMDIAKAITDYISFKIA
jgi:RimK family alpha-L-glutamate ligase